MNLALHRPGLIAVLATALVLCLSAILPRAAQATFPGKPGVIVFSLDSGGWRGEGQLYAIQPWQAEPRQLTWNEYDSEPSFAPSGQRFVFQRSSPNRPGIYQYDMVSGRVMRLVRGRSLGSPAFGRREMIAFTRDTPIGRDLFLRTAGGKLRRLTATNGMHEEEPSFTPSGKRIVFLRRSGSFKTQELCSVRIDGMDLQVIDPVKAITSPDISPNGRWLAWENLIGFDGASVGQRSLRPATPRPGFSPAEYPVYSPGGGKVAFSNYEGLWLAPVSGGRDSETLIYRTGEGFWGGGNPWPQNLAWQPLP